MTAQVSSTRTDYAPASTNLLLDLWNRLPDTVAHVAPDWVANPLPGHFRPGFEVPALDTKMTEFLAAATARWVPAGSYRDHRLTVLDLTANPETHTTKTFPSLLIVARAVEHIRRTGRRLMIVTPTSANKGTALRDATLRAIDCGLVDPDQLRIVVIAPADCRDKLRSSRLLTDPELRAANPLLVYTGPASEDVKGLAKAFAADYAGELDRQHTDLWFTLELPNYLVADTGRAAFEQAVDPTDGAPARWHAHAVSSAYGMLGYHAGREILEQQGQCRSDGRPATLLIQHLGTPDMVLSLKTGSFDRAGVPPYRRSGERLVQTDDRSFPAVCDKVDEVVDPTFYTHRPPTSQKMNVIIAEHGGDGIVISRRECLDRYRQIVPIVAATGRGLPDDPADLREWSMVMAGTGVLSAVDRGLIDPGADIVIHGSGWYSSGEYQPAEPSQLTPVGSLHDIAQAVTGTGGR